ncbi:hypothetical protein FRB94_010949 [Tulasnella sp. JGI-2019a]|nr:hypothetical protein FRB94_010949 [Tulasnella sp. JGI-2019a]
MDSSPEELYTPNEGQDRRRGKRARREVEVVPAVPVTVHACPPSYPYHHSTNQPSLRTRINPFDAPVTTHPLATDNNERKGSTVDEWTEFLRARESPARGWVLPPRKPKTSSTSSKSTPPPPSSPTHISELRHSAKALSEITYYRELSCIANGHREMICILDVDGMPDYYFPADSTAF